MNVARRAAPPPPAAARAPHQSSPTCRCARGRHGHFTAVFKDSLNPKRFYNWVLNDNTAVPVGGRERSIRWAPPAPGSYVGRFYAKDASARSRAIFSFTTTGLP